jgi:hypothetical protein
VEALPALTYVWEVDPDPDGKTLYCTGPQIERLLGFTIDVTARHEAEDRARDLEERLSRRG